MKKFFRNIALWVYLTLHRAILAISIALFNTEQEILKADPNDLDERNNHTQRMRHRNMLLEKFYAGQTDEKYVQEYYEVLKKADKFIRTATPHQMAVAADKYGTSYGMKDRWGRRYEHYGFFDDKHKHAGKTMAEVLEQEFEERRTKDDDLEIMYIFNNHPIEVGFANVFDSIGEKGSGVRVVDIWEVNLIKYPMSHVDENKVGEKVVRTRPSYVREIGFQRKAIDIVDINRASKQVTFPIHAVREREKVVNKIEELTEFLHVKKIGFEYRQLEFFIPLHFKTSELADDSDIFKEIIDIKQVYIRDEYGELIGYTVNNYNKRISYNDTHEVLKFDGIEMQTVGAPR
jgi:hypothetical protein